MQDNNSITMLNTNIIVPNKYQPRKVFDETSLNNLANSIKNYGIINPILVRKKDNKYEIIAGERRFRAAQIIGLTEVPVIIKNADEQQMAELALIENLERQNLNPIEEAKSYEEIMRIGNQTQVSLANKLNKSQSSIANKIRLLSLPQEIQDALSHRKISERHARSLLSVTDKERQLELLNQIITEKLTVKETEQLINEKDINEEEIRKAINDIMKSLNIEDDNEEEKKDKKEDDNMNNGNFFPNFDNNNVANNNASLNMMNMQSMNQAPISPEPEMVMPTVNQPLPMEQSIQTPINSMDTMMAPSQEPIMNQIPQFGQFEQQITQPEPFVAPIPEPFLGVNPAMEQPVQTPVMNEVPLFGGPQTLNNMIDQTEGFNGPQPLTMDIPNMYNTNMNQQSENSITPPLMDAPLFNPNTVMPTTEPIVNSVVEQQPIQMTENTYDTSFIAPQSFEVPVVSEPVIEPSVNKLQELQNLLNANGYEYKLYGNETTDCIIIELPRN